MLAECGGMMALARTLVDQAGRQWPMVGLLPGRASMQANLAGIGSQGLVTPQGELRGHSFHYGRFDTPLAPAAHTFRPAAEGRAEAPGEAVYRSASLTASFFHAYFPSCPAAAAALFMPG
jgi:cobyrinic acid a,c-diamide synthase